MIRMEVSRRWQHVVMLVGVHNHGGRGTIRIIRRVCARRDAGGTGAPRPDKVRQGVPRAGQLPLPLSGWLRTKTLVVENVCDAEGGDRLVRVGWRLQTDHSKAFDWLVAIM